MNLSTPAMTKLMPIGAKASLRTCICCAMTAAGTSPLIVSPSPAARGQQHLCQRPAVTGCRGAHWRVAGHLSNVEDATSMWIQHAMRYGVHDGRFAYHVGHAWSNCFASNLSNEVQKSEALGQLKRWGAVGVDCFQECSVRTCRHARAVLGFCAQWVVEVGGRTAHAVDVPKRPDYDRLLMEAPSSDCLLG